MSAIVGAVAGMAALAIVKLETNLSSLAYAAVAVAACVGAGWLVSLALPGARRDLRGLTIWTMSRETKS